MDLLIGLSSIIGLLALTGLVLYLFDYTKEFPMALVGIMMIGDLIVSWLWYMVGSEFVSDIPKFKLGISMAFMIMSFTRAIIFFVSAKKKGIL